MASVTSPDFWENLYRRPQQPWDLGAPTPALVDFVESTPPPRGRVAVPGCGRGHDARHLKRRGYTPVGIDFSPTVLRHARVLSRMEAIDVPFVEMDVFELAHPYLSAFDGVWEYTCYCAIDPARRAEYVRTVTAIVRPGGWLLACFFPVATPVAVDSGAPEIHDGASATGVSIAASRGGGANSAPTAAGTGAVPGVRSGRPDSERVAGVAGDGPPFAVDRAEVRALLAPAFRIEQELEPPRSPRGREGLEWLVYAIREPGR